jgi:predicted O-methyltransferase YrrM
LDALASEHGFATGTLDFVFLDHDKKAYLTDLESILDRGWLHPDSIVVADNVKVPGAPKYRAYTCDSSRASCGRPSSKRRTSNTRPWCPT